MDNNVKKIIGFVLNIYKKNDSDAVIKVISNEKIFFLLSKGFFKLESKNRPNIFIGSISEFEVFLKYSLNDNYLLKKATLITFFDYENNINKSIIEKLFFLFQQIEKHDPKIYEVYKNYLEKDEPYYKNFLLTYLFNLVFITKGRKLNNTFCSVCGSNQQLYCIDFNEGGMLCYKHKTKHSISNINLVKAFYQLGLSFDDYIRNVSEETNKELMNIFQVNI